MSATLCDAPSLRLVREIEPHEPPTINEVWPAELKRRAMQITVALARQRDQAVRNECQRVENLWLHEIRKLKAEYGIGV